MSGSRSWPSGDDHRADAGQAEPRATEAVLVASGHGAPEAPTLSRPRNPAGLSRRELDVLRLAARGLTTQEIADRLSISPKTADHHIQHIYNKIAVSTRASRRALGHVERRGSAIRWPFEIGANGCFHQARRSWYSRYPAAVPAILNDNHPRDA
jgi:DNA-binding CsgD family transcriptional regulator